MKYRIEEIYKELSALNKDHAHYENNVKSILEKALIKEQKLTKESCRLSIMRHNMSVGGGHRLIKGIEAIDLIDNAVVTR